MAQQLGDGEQGLTGLGDLLADDGDLGGQARCLRGIGFDDQPLDPARQTASVSLGAQLPRAQEQSRITPWIDT